VALERVAGVAPDLLVNATTVGMGDGRSPVPLEAVGVRGAVCDIVYHPPETPLLAQARALGLPCANGIGMLLHQGAAALQFWTGREPPVEAMRAALLEALAGRG
jgi:shikimate dehydrogenase